MKYTEILGLVNKEREKDIKQLEYVCNNILFVEHVLSWVFILIGCIAIIFGPDWLLAAIFTVIIQFVLMFCVYQPLSVLKDVLVVNERNTLAKIETLTKLGNA